jgi:starch-binding outer membrane protein, SusD/RagB family
MKLSKLIYICLLAAGLSSCEKVLDKENLGKVGEEDNLWNNIDLSNAFVSRIYIRNLPGWTNEYADYSEESDGGGPFMYGQLTEASVDYWPYDRIRQINILAENIDSGTLPESDKKLLKAQALFFRAWQYFEMVKRYGGVPLILRPQKVTDDLFVKRNKTSECIQQIIADLDYAIANLPTISATSNVNNGMLHKGTALAVKGRVLLYYASEQFDPTQTATGRWQAAYDANKAAKDYLDANGFGLFSSYSGIWFNEMNKEAVFVRRYQYNITNTDSKHNWSAGTRPLDESKNASGFNKPTLEIIKAFPMKDGRAIDDPSSAYTYNANYFWKNRDPRFKETIVYNGAPWEVGAQGRKPGRIQWTYVGGDKNNPSLTSYYIRKAVDENQDADQALNGSTDWIELRYAEVLLNLAEAANEIGKTNEAYTELIAIRKRAGIDPGVNNLYGLNAGMNISQMRAAVMFERKIELAFEAKRFWDLRRRRMFAAELNGKKRTGETITFKAPMNQTAWNALVNSMTSEQLLAHLDQNYANYFTHSVKIMDTASPISWKPEYYFFAIPTSHLQLNPNLQQTQGWPGGTFNPLE